MADNEKNKSPQEVSARTPCAEINKEDFQFVLKALLATYEPILEQQLKLAKNPEELRRQAESRPPNYADEIAEANHTFRKFFSEDVVLRMIPEKGRAQLGHRDNWRWCLDHLLCCFIFGWLVCRGPRTFRAWAYYVYQYWRCIRELLGTPVANPPTEEQRQDFVTLISALAAAYKPYLTDQLASVEYPAGIPDEVLNGKINSSEGQEDVCAIFERFLTSDAAPALLGREAFTAHSKDPNFWSCRCLCLCAICFGCCLARVRNLFEVRECLEYFFCCLLDCFQPLTCAITSPTDGACAKEQYYSGPGVWGVEIVGTAAGGSCDHYTLEWRDPVLLTPYTQNFVVYAPPAPATGPGACGKVNATLGYIETYGTPVPTHVEVQLTVFGSDSSQQPCTVTFDILETRVSIENVADISVPNWTDPNSQLLDASGQVLSVGDLLEILGHAWVGGCPNTQIQKYTLSYQAGFVTDPTLGTWTPFWEVDYNSPLQQAAIVSTYMDLTSCWQFVQICSPPIPPCPRPVPPYLQPYPIQYDELSPTAWYSGVASPCTAGPGTPPPQACAVDPQLPPLWASKALPSTNCFSGQYTLLLTVEDVSSNLYYDTQEVWFDNKAIYGEITGFLGVAPCAVINLSQILNAGNCSVPWPLSVQGIAYDEYIFEGNTNLPSDNFGGYCLTVTRQGGSESPPCTPVSLSVALPITTTTSVTISSATGSGLVVTYTYTVVTPGGRLLVGQPITITGLSPSGYNGTSLTIQSVTSTQFTAAGTTTGPSTGTGTGTVTVVSTTGTNRIGDPGMRCGTASPPPSPAPSHQTGTLTVADARIFDATCACKASPAPPTGFALNRGDCCAYFFTLDVWDTTICEYLSGGHHYAAAPCVLVWPVYICNDLPPLPAGTPPPCP
ncbi:MAG TPA: hypothetical protein VKO18_14965 [Terriglobia bacterium]|nr:hypothetical protein [Terriglobia bacterium]